MGIQFLHWGEHCLVFLRDLWSLNWNIPSNDHCRQPKQDIWSSWNCAEKSLETFFHCSKHCHGLSRDLWSLNWNIPSKWTLSATIGTNGGVLISRNVLISGSVLISGNGLIILCYRAVCRTSCLNGCKKGDVVSFFVNFHKLELF